MIARCDSFLLALLLMVGCALVVLLAGCGGGEDPGTAADAASKSGIPIVSCPGVTGLACQ